MSGVYTKEEHDKLIRRANKECPQWRAALISEADRRDIGALSVGNGYVYSFIYEAALAEAELHGVPMKIVLDARWQIIFDELARPERDPITPEYMKRLYPEGGVYVDEELYTLAGYQRFRQRARDGLIDPICDQHSARAFR